MKHSISNTDRAANRAERFALLTLFFSGIAMILGILCHEALAPLR